MKTPSSFKKPFILILIITALSSCALVRLKKLQNSFLKSDITSPLPATFKFTFNDFIFVKAKLNDTSIYRNFMLDTGSPCIFCYKTARAEKFKKKKLFHFGDFWFDYGRTDAQIESVKLKNLGYLVSNMAMCWKKNIYGYIGVNAMSKSIWEFNFRDTTITISDTLADFENLSGAYPVKFKSYSSQEIPVIKIAINHKDTIKAFIDTGSPDILMNSKFNTEEIQKTCPECFQTFYKNINQMGEHMKKDSIVNTNFIKINSFGIGDLELKSLVVSHMPFYKGKNLVGLDFLKNFIVTLDWKHYTMYLKPIEGRRINTNKFTYSFGFDKIDNVLKVTEVLVNGFAEKQNIRCGEEIIEIDGISADELDQDSIDFINDRSSLSKDIVVKFKNVAGEIIFKKEPLFAEQERN